MNQTYRMLRYRRRNYRVERGSSLESVLVFRLRLYRVVRRTSSSKPQQPDVVNGQLHTRKYVSLRSDFLRNLLNPAGRIRTINIMHMTPTSVNWSRPATGGGRCLTVANISPVIRYAFTGGTIAFFRVILPEQVPKI